MEKATLDLSYNDKNKKDYESFFEQLEKEGWKLENTFIDQKKRERQLLLPYND